jgi:hypothetical protein
MPRWYSRVGGVSRKISPCPSLFRCSSYVTSCMNRGVWRSAPGVESRKATGTATTAPTAAAVPYRRALPPSRQSCQSGTSSGNRAGKLLYFVPVARPVRKAESTIAPAARRGLAGCSATAPAASAAVTKKAAGVSTAM